MLGGGVNSAVGRTHVTALRMDGEYQLVGGCFSRDASVNHDSAVRYGLPRAASDLDALLREHGDVDAIVVATPIGSHEDQLHAILDAGLRAITDKPLVATAAGARRLAARMEGSATAVLAIYNYTGYPAVRDLRNRVRRGDLGEVHRIVLEMPQDTYQRLVNTGGEDRVQQWRRRDGDSACVSLDLFVHLHSLASYLTDRSLVAVTARSRSVAALEDGLVDDVDALLDFDGPLTGTAWYGKAALGDANGLRVRLFGDGGAASWDQRTPGVLVLADQSGTTTIQDAAAPGSTVADEHRYQRFKAGHPSGFVEAFANYYVDVADAVRTGRPGDHLLGVDVAVEGLAACEAIAASSAAGERVPVTA